MKLARKASLATACSLAFATAVFAQPCVPVVGTGCPGVPQPGCLGSGRIGTSLGVSCGSFCRSGPTRSLFLQISTCLSPPLTLLPPIACGARPCNVGVVLPGIVIPVPGVPTVTVQIPRNPALVGVIACLQCACRETAPPCFRVSPVVALNIRP